MSNTKKYDLLIKGGTVVSATDSSVMDIGIVDGKIIDLGDLSGNATEIIDGDGLHILPGIIDSQVHFREPGLEHKETIETGSRAAVLGGVTTFLEMPNTNPPTTTFESVQNKINIGKKTSYANFGFFIGATGENTKELLKTAGSTGCPGVKIFLGSSTGTLLLYDTEKLRDVFSRVKAPIAVHSENEEMLRSRIDIFKNATSVHDHYKWRDVETALSSTKKIIELCKEVGRKVHVLHISTADEMEFLKGQKDFCTVEATPQHLTLAAPDCYDRLDTFAQMNPPVRDENHRKGIWEGIFDGTVDVIGSDHAPHTVEEKKQGYPRSPSGMPGVQTILPLMLHHMNEGKISLHKLVHLLCERPAELYGLKNKGQIKVGADADITIVDLKKEWEILDCDMGSKVSWTPFHKMRIIGKPLSTIVGGRIVMKDGKIIKEAKGLPVEIE